MLPGMIPLNDDIDRVVHNVEEGLPETDAPAAEVERVVDLVFTRMTQKGVGGADVVKVSAENQLRGVTIPLHEGAARATPIGER